MLMENIVLILVGIVYTFALGVYFKKKVNELAQAEIKVPSSLTKLKAKVNNQSNNVIYLEDRKVSCL